MKISEVCDLTGLTERAVRFYVEKELVTPARERRNGRDYIEFDENDAATLTDVASLRDVGFSIDEIHRMQTEPSSIPALVGERRATLVAEARESAYAAAAVGLAAAGDMESVLDVHALACALRGAAVALPQAKEAQTVQPALPGLLTAEDEWAQRARQWQEVKRDVPPRTVRDEWVNTSGMGDMSDVPYEYRDKWNWGAFLMPILWGLSNHVYKALLCCIPIIGLFASFYIAAHGYELAWRGKRWDSVEEFDKSQRRWGWGALVPYAVMLAIIIIVPAAEASEAKNLAEANAQMQTEHFPGLERAVLDNAQYMALIGGRDKLEGGDLDAFFADADAYYMTYGFEPGSVQYAGAYAMGFMLTLSDGRVYYVQCSQYRDDPFDVTISENEYATLNNLISYGKYEPLNTMRAEYIAKTTPIIEGSEAWRAIFADGFTYAQEPAPICESYAYFYGEATDEEVLSGWMALVRAADGTLYRVECEAVGTDELRIFPIEETAEQKSP